MLFFHQLASFSSLGFKGTMVLERVTFLIFLYFSNLNSHVVISTLKIDFGNAGSLAYYFCSEVEWFYFGFISVLSISISAIVMILMVFDEKLRFSFYHFHAHAIILLMECYSHNKASQS